MNSNNYFWSFVLLTLGNFNIIQSTPVPTSSPQNQSNPAGSKAVMSVWAKKAGGRFKTTPRITVRNINDNNASVTAWSTSEPPTVSSPTDDKVTKFEDYEYTTEEDSESVELVRSWCLKGYLRYPRSGWCVPRYCDWTRNSRHGFCEMRHGHYSRNINQYSPVLVRTSRGYYKQRPKFVMKG